jgi:hypothetical protein
VITSDKTGEIAKALAAAQTQLGPVLRDKTVRVSGDKGTYTFDYADLASVVEVCRTALSQQSIAIVQGVETEQGGVKVETRLIHSSGEWLSSAITMRGAADKPQAVGSLITYARRYALSAMVGVASEEDDDANVAEGNSRQISTRPLSPQAQARSAAVKAGKDPVARLEAVKARALKLYANIPDAKSQLGKCLGRTFGEGPIAGLSEAELDQAEAWLTLEQAAKAKG